MIRDNIKLISDCVSGKRAFNHVEKLSGFHRIQASEGYRDAAMYCCHTMKDSGIGCRILEFPADGKTVYWTQKMFAEWNCKSAHLRLKYPLNVMLCDYGESNMCIVQRSTATNLKDYAIVMMDRGNEPCRYKDIDFKDKIIFVHGDHYDGYMWAINDMGAIGMITDYMSETFTRSRNDLYDERLYLTFAWMNEDTDNKTFGFVLTPRDGDTLAEICRRVNAEYKSGLSAFQYPTADAFIDAEFKNGSIEAVEACIEGETDEEIIVTAHLCHPKPSANDNASGCAGALESMRALNSLIASGLLKKPKRSIRMVLVPEVTGTFAYLHRREQDLSKIKSGLNLDMIGRRQEGKSGLLGIMGVPDAAPSFVIDLMAYIVEELSNEIHTFNIGTYVSPYRIELLEYFGGSDNYVYCDPTIGIPCVTMMQWLDKTYHSSGDTTGVIDAGMLEKSCSIAASYLYTMSTLSLDDILHILLKIRQRFVNKLIDLLSNGLSENADISMAVKFDYYKNIAAEACRDIERFFTGDDLTHVHNIVETEINLMNKIHEDLYINYLQTSAAKAEKERQSCVNAAFLRIPVRRFKGPISFMGYFDSLGKDVPDKLGRIKAKYPDLYGFNSIDAFIAHRMDGKRNINEIAELVGIEGNFYNVEYVNEYVDFLNELNLVSLLNNKEDTYAGNTDTDS